MEINNIGQNLKLMRKRAGISREELAEKTQLSYSYLSKIENGGGTPGIETIIRLSLELRVPIEFFLKDNGQRLFTTYANSFIIDEMNKMPDDDFDLFSKLIGTLFECLIKEGRIG